MSDNTQLNSGTGGDVIATDEVSTLNGAASTGVKVQRVKVLFGDDGSATDASASNPLPVALASQPLPAGAATETGNLATIASRLPPLGQATLAESQPVAIASDQVLPITAQGELVEALEAMRMAVQAMTRTLGQMQPDTAARMRVALDSITAGLTLATITTITTVTTVSTLSNITSIGGNAATEQIPSLMRLGADSMRRNITVT